MGVSKGYRSFLNVGFLAASLLTLSACSEPSADAIESKRQEVQRQEQVKRIGAPSIMNDKEKNDLKEIYELRDRSNVVTFTYLQSDVNGCLMRLSITDGFPMSVATQFTSPYRVDGRGWQHPQPEPNGLFPPNSAEGSWVKAANPANAKEVKTIYGEPRMITSPFRFKHLECPVPRPELLPKGFED